MVKRLEYAESPACLLFVDGISGLVIGCIEIACDFCFV